MALDKNLKNLQALLSVLETDHLTKEDFFAHFEKVVKIVKNIEQKNIEEIEAMKGAVKLLGERLEQKTDIDVSSLSDKAIKYCSQEMIKMSNAQKAKMKEMDSKMSDVKNGMDADNDYIADKVSDTIKKPIIDEIEKDLPQLGESIRDGLEILSGDERLDVSAIKGLEELLKELKKPVSMGGGLSTLALSMRFVDDETPSGDVDGVNTVFTLSKTPQTGSLKVFVGGARQRITEDYTLSNKTITFNVAPETGSILLVDYRI